MERGFLRGRLLLDGDGRRQPVDVVDVRLLHHLQELARVGRQALDVAALALGIDRVERQRGLARAGQPREHDQRVARDLQVDVLQVVLARAADMDRLAGRGARGLGGLAHERGSSANELDRQCEPQPPAQPAAIRWQEGGLQLVAVGPAATPQTLRRTAPHMSSSGLSEDPGCGPARFVARG